jgi:prepilin-type N-terminal cleavage/methylation domain-containing protein
MHKLLPKTQFNLQGFTLVELMISIAIVAILATVGFTVYSNTQSSARDAKRRQDIDAIADAIEGKKTPGLATYVPLATTDFSGGAIPTDPKKTASTNPQEYCIVTYAPAGAPPLPPAIADSTTFTSKTTCANSLAPAPAVSAPVSTTTPVALTTTWKICAFLEQGTNAIYCRTSN